MRLIVGLGNPGREYELSRHNAGFLVLDHWSEKRGLAFRHDELFDFVRAGNACLIKPKTYMNRSGRALSEALRRWQPEDILVVHDDIELPLAQLRLRNGGGAGGHNGLKSLFQIMSPEDLRRLRLGIGRDEGDPRDFVLDRFTPEELEAMRPVLEQAGDYLEVFIKEGFNAVLDAFSRWKKSCSGAEDPGNIGPKEK